jgi:hypothetical protein
MASNATEKPEVSQVTAAYSRISRAMWQESSACLHAKSRAMWQDRETEGFAGGVR